MSITSKFYLDIFFSKKSLFICIFHFFVVPLHRINASTMDGRSKKLLIMDKKLAIMATIKDGLAIALVNYLSLILTVVLYFVTIWIPYLNVGTTIAVSSLPAEMAKGTVINPLFIFDGKYRRNMGEYLFGIIPGFVISVAWSFAVVLFVDKDMSAMDALHESNRLTYGHKWRIFGTEFLLVICLELVIVIIQFLFGIGEVSWIETIGKILIFILTIFAVPAMLGVEASIYKQLTSGAFLADTPAEAPASAPQPAPQPAPAAPAAQPAAEAPAAAPSPAPAAQPAAEAPAAE